MTQVFVANPKTIETSGSLDVSESGASLYEQDFNLWVEATAQLLREGRLSELDVVNLLEEVESMGNSDKHALSSNLVVILLHLLKWRYQPHKRTRSWEKSIAEHRRRVIEIFEASPSLKRYYAEIFDKCYKNARKQARIETRLSLEAFPVVSPFTIEQAIDEDFLPE
ncbi:MULTISPECIES: DUF29 domain-containing protein [Pseudanabaena]|uniref:DUF29 domain-containing protein n=2 Tax=Pseudanabaena TaxID=1152 RepID=L8MTR1_9CYAN|nr:MULTISPECIES: DUF29 domain-containing protein [Pseudanabaena]ELS30816.1 protein of unknown function DUF29 [Pseudanabaena biceps PCC 7429]MDG3496914.1 DUF29 domain-containing protein [Pseudanabaena catenata USMAC16]